MVFYFSGTGNSQRVAKQLGAVLGDELVSINQVLKSGEQQTFHSERPLVFVVPTYAWRMPKVVSDWILASHFEGNQHAYFILTCGGNWATPPPMPRNCAKKQSCNFAVWRWWSCQTTMWHYPTHQTKQNVR